MIGSILLKLLILGLVTPTSLDKCLKLHADRLVMPLPKWSLAKNITDFKLIFGHAESSYLRWFVDTCPLKIATPRSYTKKYCLESTCSPISYHRSSKTYFRKFWMWTQVKDIVWSKFTAINGVKKATEFL